VTRRALTDGEVAEGLGRVPGWERRGDRIARSFRFRDFAEAFGWMTSVALVAERLDHHPEWRNVWATVEVELTTHDAGGITALDFELAEAMERLAAERPRVAQGGARDGGAE
jgi:4a-hydroxytetrahydrobiopterin dehydratase